MRTGLATNDIGNQELIAAKQVSFRKDYSDNQQKE